MLDIILLIVGVLTLILVLGIVLRINLFSTIEKKQEQNAYIMRGNKLISIIGLGTILVAFEMLDISIHGFFQVRSYSTNFSYVTGIIGFFILLFVGISLIISFFRHKMILTDQKIIVQHYKNNTEMKWNEIIGVIARKGHSIIVKSQHDQIEFKDYYIGFYTFIELLEKYVSHDILQQSLVPFKRKRRYLKRNVN